MPSARYDNQEPIADLRVWSEANPGEQLRVE